MELTEDLIKAHSLSEEAVKAINTVTSDSEATIKQEFEGKANENAEGILTGVAKSLSNEFNVGIEREQGEKFEPFLARLSDATIKGKELELNTARIEYEEKTKNFKGAESVQKEYDSLKSRLDDIQKKHADYDDIKKEAANAKGYSEELSGLKLEVAFGNLKPAFPETANAFEVDAKWNAFKEGVLKEYDIEIVDGKPVAINKENQYKTKQLSELLEADGSIQSLKEGRKQGGLDSQNREKELSIEGVPFKLNANATSEERGDAVRNYLLNDKKLNKLSPEYAKEYAELSDKIRKG